MPDQVQQDQVLQPAPAQSGGVQLEDLRAAVGVLADVVERLHTSPSPEPAPEPAASTDVLGDVCAAVAGPAAVAVESRLRSSRLWTTIGGVGALGIGHFAGLPPITQGCITTLVGLYCILRTIQGGR